jgi:hypothetical protein
LELEEKNKYPDFLHKKMNNRRHTLNSVCYRLIFYIIYVTAIPFPGRSGCRPA